MKKKYVVVLKETERIVQRGDVQRGPEIYDSLKEAERAVREILDGDYLPVEDIHVYVITAECKLVATKVTVLPPDYTG